MAINQTDKDVLEHFQEVMGGRLNGPYSHPGRKPIWAWGINNWPEVKVACATLYPWLGARRRQQIDDVLVNEPEFTRGPVAPPGCPDKPFPSVAGVQRHRKLGEPPCDICRESNRLYMQEYKKRRTHRWATLHCPSEVVCSPNGYHAHTRLGIPPCDICAESNRWYRREAAAKRRSRLKQTV